jgi:hypothetical protein
MDFLKIHQKKDFEQNINLKKNLQKIKKLINYNN